MRPEVKRLYLLGPFPSEDGATQEKVEQYEQLIRALNGSVINSEARLLVKSFGSDTFYGLASSLMHLIETSPGWPLRDCLADSDNEWIDMLRTRAINGGYTV